MNARALIHRMVSALLVMSLFLGYHPVSAQTSVETAVMQPPVVRAVLFHSHICTFCRQIVEQDLPPVIQEFGEQLQILYVDVDTIVGENLYRAALKVFGLPRGVPCLFIDKTSVGGVNIPKQLPALVKAYLARGGTDWPAIPGLDEYRAARQVAETHTTSASLPPTIASPLAVISTPLPAESVPAAGVRAVLFWKDGCAHCHEVLENVLPPLQEKYGQQLEILLVEVVTLEDVDRLYELAAAYGIPRERVGVPFLILGEQVLIGSTQILAEFPGLISPYLAQGGLDWPNNPILAGLIPTPIPGIESPVLRSPVDEATPVPMEFPLTSTGSVRDNGFTLAIVVLAGMLISLLYALGRLTYGVIKDIHLAPLPAWRDWLILILCAIGLGVAGYLSYIEISSSQAICGPVGNCNGVQTSSYARLWGVLPVGVLGAGGYIAIFAAWWAARQKWGWLSSYVPMAMFGMTFFGTIFSAYLTYLEPYVIKAVCIWCITSSILITLLLLLSIHPALHSLIGAPHAEETPS